MIYFLVGFVVGHVEPVWWLIVLPFKALKLFYCAAIFPAYIYRLRRLTEKMAYDQGVESAINWARTQPKTIRDLYRWRF